MSVVNKLEPISPESFARLSQLLFGPAEDPHIAILAEEVCRHKAIMVTGAGGSIGSVICQKLARMQTATVVMFDVSEAALYRVHRDVGFDKRFVPVIGDIRDRHKLDIVMRAYVPKLVLHAAALKHVDMLEIPLNLAEAVSTNVLGTDRVCEAASKHRAQVVMISTDKAVNPTSVLGLTKRIAERVVAQWSLVADMSVVRFGNVMNSSGSAIPLFRDQIVKGGPVTITDVNMTRYMMTLGQAVDLVLAACCDKTGLYVLDMGDPVKIIDLARMLIRMADLEPIRDIDIVEIGIRPGEKLAEELLYDYELVVAESKGGMFSVPMPLSTEHQWEFVKDVLDMDILAASREKLMSTLCAACPEYVG